jgi:hypothetical protein
MRIGLYDLGGHRLVSQVDAAHPRGRLMTHNRVPLSHFRYDIAHSWRINPGRPIKVELARSTYTLDEVAQGFSDLHAGVNIRGVVRFD